MTIREGDTERRRHELAVVMPVYNEGGRASRAAGQWLGRLRAMGIDFVFFVLDDGSTAPETIRAIDSLAGESEVRLIRKDNEGHGPTIHRGYRLAVELARWVLQVDSDGDLSPEEFPAFWQAREASDLLIAERRARRQPRDRRFATVMASFLVRMLFGAGARDVNAPYRLVRASALRSALERIPPGAFAPNVMMSALAARQRWRIANMPMVDTEGGRPSALRHGRLWKACATSFRDLIALAWACRHS